MVRRQKIPAYSGNLGSKVGVVSNYGHVGLLDADTNVVPAGGTTGQVLVKDSGTDYDVSWSSIAVPTGGTAGQILVKNSDTNYDISWANVNCIKATYDFAVDGGTVGDITLMSAPTFPDNSIITHVIYDVVTELTSTSNDGTIKFKFGTDGDLTDALTASAGVELGIYEGKPGNFALDGNALTAANMAVAKKATYIKLSAARKPQVEIATHDITAGKINCYIWYVVSE